MKKNDYRSDMVIFQMTRIKAIILLLVLVIVWMFMTLGAWFVAKERFSNRVSLSGKNAFPLLNPNLQFLDYNSPEERRANTVVSMVTLRDGLESFLGDKKSQIGIYAEDLNTGAWIGINEKQKFVPASLIKVSFAMAALKKVDKGIWTMDTKILLQPKFKNNKYGELWKLPDFSDVPLQKVLEELITSSDNTAVSMIYYSLTKEEREEVFYHIGQRNPDENPEFPYVIEMYSPKEIATAYRILYNSSFLTRKNSQYLLDLLARTKFRQEIPRSIPDSIKISHKIGEGTRASKPEIKQITYNDCGIVYYPQRPYVICVMTEGFDLKDSSDLIAAVSDRVYKYLDEYSGKSR